MPFAPGKEFYLYLVSIMDKDGKHKHHRTSASEVWVDEEGIMHVLFDKGIELKLADMEEAYALFRQLGVGPGQKKSRQLLSGGPFTISKEARGYAGKSGTDYFHAAAMVTDSAL